jgi:hypothetical protein
VIPAWAALRVIAEAYPGGSFGGGASDRSDETGGGPLSPATLAEQRQSAESGIARSAAGLARMAGNRSKVNSLTLFAFLAESNRQERSPLLDSHSANGGRRRSSATVLSTRLRRHGPHSANAMTALKMSMTTRRFAPALKRLRSRFRHRWNTPTITDAPRRAHASPLTTAESLP